MNIDDKIKEATKDFVTISEVQELVDVIESMENNLKHYRKAIEVLRKVNLHLADRVKQLEIHNEIQGYLNE